MSDTWNLGRATGATSPFLRGPLRVCPCPAGARLPRPDARGGHRRPRLRAARRPPSPPRPRRRRAERSRSAPMTGKSRRCPQPPIALAGGTSPSRSMTCPRRNGRCSMGAELRSVRSSPSRRTMGGWSPGATSPTPRATSSSSRHGAAARDRTRRRRPPDHRGSLVDGTGGAASRGRWPAAMAASTSARRLATDEVRGASDRRDRDGGRARLHRPALALAGSMILADPRHEPKVRPGRHDRGHRRRRPRYAPFRPGGPRRASSTERGARRPARHRLRLDDRRRATSTAYDGRPSRSTSASWSATARCASAPSAGTTSPADARASPTCGRCCARRWRRAPSACRSGLDYPPGSYATTDELAAAHRRGAAPAASITPTSATRSATATSTRSGRRSRSAGAATGPAHITHFYHRQTHPGRPGAAARPGR